MVNNKYISTWKSYISSCWIYRS